ncbi:hypothetical protein [Streptomyces sp.]|uniref:hypothetical protein n=1 Tax=Streptomyces sp. TaxID=1931 RepID=UPI002811EA7D|nr:hypothetical protein [Streptomyces sp.]
MMRVEDGRGYRWGQLFAALVAMRGLAEGGRIVPAPPGEVRAATYNPYNDSLRLLRDVGHRLFAARERGGPVAEAAVVVMADVSRLVPPRRETRDGLGGPAAQHFRQGYEARLAAYRESWADLVD